jgi:hypothetical protein
MHWEIEKEITLLSIIFFDSLYSVCATIIL